MPVELESGDSRCWAEISTAAVRKNARYLAKRVGKASLLAVVKADAYGHGAPEITSLLLKEGVRTFCVASPEEGRALRDAGCADCEILVFGGFKIADFPYYREYDLIPTLSDLQQLKELDSFCEKHGLTAGCHIKVDTGMNRYGIDASVVAEQPGAIFQLARVTVKGMYSHLSSASGTGDAAAVEYTMNQIKTFRGLSDYLELNNIWSGTRHLLNSGGILYYPQASLDGVRPGLALYGYYPGPPAASGGLHPSMTFRARVVSVRTLPAGVSVGYDRTFHTKRITKMALVAAGYADGYPVGLSNRGQVLIGRNLHPVIGRVCMDTILVDVTGHSVRPGAIATLWGGSGPALEDVAGLAGTIPYELTTRMPGRVPRRYVR